MENFTLELTPMMIAMIPVIAAVLQLAKNFPPLVEQKQWFPLLSLALGVGLAYLQKMPNPIMAGILMGLTANGSYDVLKNKVKNEPKSL